MCRLAAAVLLGFCSAALAEDVYYEARIRDVEIVEGALPKAGGDRWVWPLHGDAFQPRVVVDGAGEGYVDFDSGTPFDENFGELHVRISVPAAREVTGWIFLPQLDQRRMVRARFRIAKTQTQCTEERFLVARRKHYTWALDAGVSGAAWFRHEAALRGDLRDQAPRRPDEYGLESTFDLFTGTRAISENLQLDRAMPGGGRAPGTRALDSIEGITVRKFDFGSTDAPIEMDPLARLIPGDQLAIFFPSFDAMIRMMDAADESGTPILHSIETRTEDSLTRERYERQLCLKAGELSRMLGPTFVASVAFTAGDPFLRTGSDVAILFEAKDKTLATLIQAARVVQATGEGADGVKGEIQGVPYDGYVSVGRRVCSYQATIGTTVVVTNSLGQLAAVVERGGGDGTRRSKLASSLVHQPEYLFFRNRYKRGTGETAFLVVPDDAIRKWCGPRWRIAESRRVRADAALAELEARDAATFARGEAWGPLEAPWSPVDLGPLTRTPKGIRSEIYNTRAFLTPVAELPIDRVTEAEASAYELWRDGYQRNWSNYFDPIAVRLELDEKRAAADVTVMPLIAGTDYAEFVDLVRGAKISLGAGDPHEGTLLHWILAIDANSALAKRSDDFLAGLAGKGMGPLSWMGQTVSIYVEQDPFWEEASKAPDADKFIEENLSRLPIAVRADVKDPVKCAIFLSLLRTFIDRSAPGMVEWETKKHGEQEYVTVGPSAKAREGMGVMSKLTFCYVTLPDALVLTLNEGVIERAIDRRVAKETGGAGGAEPAPWLGDHLCLSADRGLLGVLDVMGSLDETFRERMRRASWSNLWILNEWKRLFPDRDPMELNERFLGVRVVCPGGGKYVWNEAWKTMESTVYGHPGEPKDGPADALPLKGWRSGRFGLTFEKDGLRARCELRRE